MSSTLNTYVYSTLTLTSTGTYSVPLTISAGAGVKIGTTTYTGQSGVYDNTASASSGYTLINNGYIAAGDGLAKTVGGIGVNMRVAASVLNTGKIYGGDTQSGAAGAGVYLAGGSLVNSGIIAGGYGGLLATGTSTSNGTGGAGVSVNKSASVTNSGTIYGGDGYQSGKEGTGVLLNSGTLTNSGTIEGGTYFALDTATGYYDIPEILGTGVQLSAGTTLTNSGTIIGGSTGIKLSGGTIINSGTITSSTGASAVNFNKTTGGKLELEVPNSSGVSSAGITGNITNFTKGDTVQIANMTVSQVTANFNTTTDTLADNGNITFTPIVSGEQFIFTADANGGTDITTTACYRLGTHIRTKSGDRLIEELAIGDELMTLSGAIRPIRWIGRIRHSQFFAAGNRDVQPVRICAGALAHDVPLRDLWVSPDHAMLVDGMLIPARSLVNGLTIWQDETPQDVTYIHVEFETHDLIYAEGAVSETYVDEDTRAMFDNAEDYKLRYPGALSVAAILCAPRLEEGYQVEMVRDRLKVRAEQMLGLPETSVLLENASSYRGNTAAFSRVRT